MEDYSQTDHSENTYRIEVEYEGSEYFGWQRQPDHTTVQGTLEEAVEDLFQERTRVRGAGRTDAGVHAVQMTAHFRVQKFRKPEVVKSAFNDFLPNDIVVLQVQQEDASFHARFDAEAKMYRYVIHHRDVPSVFWRRFAWWVPYDLNQEAMSKAGEELVGKHDFASFAARTPEEENTVCTVYRLGLNCYSRFTCVTVMGDRFLYKMVRAMVGTLVEIGRGQMDADAISDILVAKSIEKAGSVAPACGLHLIRVFYNNDGNYFQHY